MRTRILLSLALATMLLAVGCRTDKASEKQPPAATQASPTAPGDTASQPPPAPAANPAQPSTAPEPKLKTRPQANEPVETAKSEAPQPAQPEASPTPTPTPAPPIVIPAGTTISVRTMGPIGTKNAQANQQFQASLSRPLMVGDQIAVPKGAPAAGAVPEAKSAGRIKGEGGLSLVLTTLMVNGKAYQIKTDPVVIKAKGRGKRSAAMIGGGGGAGALIGGLAGGGKGAAIGALAGAGAGTAGATMTGNRDVQVPAETIVSFRLSKPLTLPPRQGGPSTEENPGLQERPQGTAPSPDTSTPPPAQPPEKGSQPPPKPPC